MSLPKISTRSPTHDPGRRQVHGPLHGRIHVGKPEFRIIFDMNMRSGVFSNSARKRSSISRRGVLGALRAVRSLFMSQNDSSILSLNPAISSISNRRNPCVLETRSFLKKERKMIANPSLEQPFKIAVRRHELAQFGSLQFVYAAENRAAGQIGRCLPRLSAVMTRERVPLLAACGIRLCHR